MARTEFCSSTLFTKIISPSQAAILAAVSRISLLSLPFRKFYPATNRFAEPPSAELAKKYSAWGIIGHQGIDFSLPEATVVLAVDSGVVSQSGLNADFGVSITIKHRWGESFYAHLKEVTVAKQHLVRRGSPIGRSGSSGIATGPHLHFAIRPHNFNKENGYQGFIDPEPYLPRLTWPNSLPAGRNVIDLY